MNYPIVTPILSTIMVDEEKYIKKRSHYLKAGT
jgi:hypothetical protein